MIAGRRINRGEALVASLKESGCDAYFVETDVRSADSISRMVSRTIALYGRLDCAVNCAGVAGANALTADYPAAAWDEVISVNLTGVWLCMKHEIPELLKYPGGSIVNVSSDLGQVGSDLGVVAYVASKHGVIGLTRAAALEYAARGLRVNAVCPSFTETEMLEPALASGPDAVRRVLSKHIPLQRIASPEEIAAAILWLCSAASSFVTGHALAIDGGVLAR